MQSNKKRGRKERKLKVKKVNEVSLNVFGKNIAQTVACFKGKYMLNWETKKGFHYWGNILKCQRSHTCAPQQLLRLTENKNVSYHFLKIS